MPASAKSFDYEVSLDETWDGWSDRGGGVLAGADEASWTPEHLVLAGLARCSLTSLRHHCVRARRSCSRRRAAAHGTVTRREADGRFAFVEIACEADVAFDPKPDDGDRRRAAAKARARLLRRAHR